MNPNVCFTNPGEEGVLKGRLGRLSLYCRNILAEFSLEVHVSVFYATTLDAIHIRTV